MMDDFGHIPNAAGFARYMAKRCSDGTWCVWDFRTGTEADTTGDVSENQCRVLAANYNRAGHTMESGEVERW
jgi:hypothetical protein